MKGPPGGGPFGNNSVDLMLLEAAEVVEGVKGLVIAGRAGQFDFGVMLEYRRFHLREDGEHDDRMLAANAGKPEVALPMVSSKHELDSAAETPIAQLAGVKGFTLPAF